MRLADRISIGKCLLTERPVPCENNTRYPVRAHSSFSPPEARPRFTAPAVVVEVMAAATRRRYRLPVPVYDEWERELDDDIYCPDRRNSGICHPLAI